MKFQGIVTLVKKDGVTGEVLDTQVQTNIVTDQMYYRWSLWDNIDRIFISSAENIIPNVRRSYVPNILGFGTNIVGIDSPSLMTENDPNPMYIEWSQRFQAPASPRTIRVIGLTPDTVFTNGSAQSFAYLALSSPCTQSTTEILDVFYRLQIVDDGSLNDFSLETFFNHKFRNNSNSSLTDQYPYGYIWPSIDQSYPYLSSQSHNNALSSASFKTSDSFPYVELKYLNTVNDNLGRIVGSVSFDSSGSDSTSALYNTKFKPSTVSSVQGIFNHGPTATLPFFEAGTGAVGAGRISVTDAGWNQNLFPEMFRVDVDTAGVAGVSTYKYSVREAMGFAGNSYTDLSASIPWLFDTNPENGIPLDYVDMTGVSYENEVVTMFHGDLATIIECDLSTQTNKYYTIANGSIPATFTDIFRVRRINGELWLTSKAGGLAKISADGLTTTQYDVATFPTPSSMTNQAYALCEGAANSVWVIFNGGLAMTADAGASWTTYNDITPTTFISTTWTNYNNIAVDPNSPNNNMGISWYSGGAGYLLWWNTATGGSVTQVTGTNSTSLCSNSIITYEGNHSFKVSPDGVYTVSKGRVALESRPIFSTYGSLTFWTHTATTNSPREVQFLKNAADEECFVHTTSGVVELIRTSDGVATDTFDYINYGSPFAGFNVDTITPESFILFGLTYFTPRGGCCRLRTFTDHSDPYSGLAKKHVWRTYGWDGAAWVLDHAGSKATHAGTDVLENGVTVSFDNNGGQFESGDYHTFGMADGIWFDGATEYYFRSGFYFKTLVQNNEIESSVIPSVDSTLVVPYETAMQPGSNFGLTADSFGNVTGSDYTFQTTSNTTLDPTFPETPSGFARTAMSFSNDMFYKVRSQNTANTHGFILGLVPDTIIGDPLPIDDSDITHGFWFNRRPGDTNGIFIREGGVTVFTPIDTFPAYGTASYSEANTLAIERIGTTVNYWISDTLVYTSLVPSAGTVHLQMHLDKGSGGFQPFYNSVNHSETIQMPLTGKILRLGDLGNTTGAFDPDLHRIAASQSYQYDMDVIIDGTKAFVYVNSAASHVLATNQVAVYTRSGVIRFSDDDAGKTVTVSYSYCKD